MTALSKLGVRTRAGAGATPAEASPREARRGKTMMTYTRNTSVSFKTTRCYFTFMFDYYIWCYHGRCNSHKSILEVLLYLPPITPLLDINQSVKHPKTGTPKFFVYNSPTKKEHKASAQAEFARIQLLMQTKSMQIDYCKRPITTARLALYSAINKRIWYLSFVQ